MNTRIRPIFVENLRLFTEIDRRRVETPELDGERDAWEQYFSDLFPHLCMTDEEWERVSVAHQ